MIHIFDSDAVWNHLNDYVSHIVKINIYNTIHCISLIFGNMLCISYPSRLLEHQFEYRVVYHL